MIVRIASLNLIWNYLPVTNYIIEANLNVLHKAFHEIYNFEFIINLYLEPITDPEKN